MERKLAREYNLQYKRVGHTTNVSSATHSGHPEITEYESGRYEAENGRMSHSTNRPRAGGPEIWFQIVHSAVHDRNGSNLATHREQEVEVALGPIGIIEDARVGILTRRIEADQVVRVVPLTQGDFKPPPKPKTPRIAELLRKAMEWRRQVDAGEVRNQAEIACREGITRARVTQVMGMLRLSPEIKEHILSLPEMARRPSITERMLRPVGAIADQRDQVRKFRKLRYAPLSSSLPSFKR